MVWELVLPRRGAAAARVVGCAGRPSVFRPVRAVLRPADVSVLDTEEMYLPLMFLTFRYWPGYESLYREVTDSITGRRFGRIPLDGAVPHPTTLMKLTTWCGSAAVDELNEAMLGKAAEAKLLRTNRIRADTTVVAANVAYPMDAGLVAMAVGRIAATGKRAVARVVVSTALYSSSVFLWRFTVIGGGARMGWCRRCAGR